MKGILRGCQLWRDAGFLYTAVKQCDVHKLKQFVGFTVKRKGPSVIFSAAVPGVQVLDAAALTPDRSAVCYAHAFTPVGTVSSSASSCKMTRAASEFSRKACLRLFGHSFLHILYVLLCINKLLRLISSYLPTIVRL